MEVLNALYAHPWWTTLWLVLVLAFVSEMVRLKK
jgi:hypothetical protein